MSRLGKKPIKLLDGVSVEVTASDIRVTGRLGALILPILKDTKVEVNEEKKEIIVRSEKKYKQARANWGTMRSLVNQSVEGVAVGFAKVLELVGIGFRVTLAGEELVLNIGFSHPVKFNIPADVKVTVEKNLIKIFGISKQAVGEVAASIRRIKKPDPYQGKGIRYQGEVIIKKAGKKAIGAGAK